MFPEARSISRMNAIPSDHIIIYIKLHSMQAIQQHAENKNFLASIIVIQCASPPLCDRVGERRRRGPPRRGCGVAASRRRRGRPQSSNALTPLVGARHSPAGVYTKDREKPSFHIERSLASGPA